MGSPYRWPQVVRQHLCSISYCFAARWPNMKHDSVFYGIFLSPELFIVESRAIAPIVGFWVYNTIKQKNSKVGQRSKTRSIIKITDFGTFLCSNAHIFVSNKQKCFKFGRSTYLKVIHDISQKYFKREFNFRFYRQ